MALKILAIMKKGEPTKTQIALEVVSVDRSNLKKAYEKFDYASDEIVDFVYFGCSHYTLEEAQKVALLFTGNQCKVNLWIVISHWAFIMAMKMGYMGVLRSAGGVLSSGTCPAMMDRFMPPNTDVMATDSAK